MARLRRFLRGGLVRALVGCLITGGLLVLLARSVSLPRIADALGQSDVRLVPVAIGLFFLGIWVRSIRWSALVDTPGVGPRQLFPALVVGLTINNLVPARIGEVARAYLLKSWCGVPYGRTVATLVVERLLDGIVLAALCLASLAFIPAPGYLVAVAVTLGGLFLGLLVVLIVATAWRDLLVKLIDFAVGRLPGRFSTAVRSAAFHFVDGLVAIRGPRALGQLLVLSVGAWVAELGLFYVLLLALPGLAPFASAPLAAIVGGMGNFATLVPASPGYVGTFDGAVVKVLSDTTRAPVNVAAAYALLTHFVVLVPITAVGAVILLRENLTPALLRANARPLESSPLAQ